MQWTQRRDKPPAPSGGKASRSLDFPVTFRVRGVDSSNTATLLQLGLRSCRIRTWRMMASGERITVELPQSGGDTLAIAGNVRETVRVSQNSYDYGIDLEALPPEREELLAREAALLVRRRLTPISL
jgi:hypothetical protein